MNTARPVLPGKSRRCPHCRSDILESASICPICRHHLRFDQIAEPSGARFSALHVEGTIRHPAEHGPWEYSVVIAIRNQKGEEIARQVVGIGAMHGVDSRSFDLSVEVYAPEVGVVEPIPQRAPEVRKERSGMLSAPRTIPARKPTDR